MPFIAFVPNMTCVKACPAGYYISSGNLCQSLTNQTDFPAINLTYYIQRSQLYLRLQFTSPVQWKKDINSSWITVSMQSPYPTTNRLLAQSQVAATVVNQSSTEVSLLLAIYDAVNQASFSVSLSNFFLSSVAANSSGLLLQQSDFLVTVPYFQAYPPDYVGMGFQRVGEVICGAVYLLSLGFLVVNRFCELYLLIDVLQEIYLLSFVEILYPPNLGELLIGFKNAHLSFFPNLFWGLFDSGYREYAPVKFNELSVDINFLRNAGHIYTVLLVLLCWYLLLQLVRYILSKVPDRHEKIKSCIPQIEQQLLLLKGSYLTDIVLTLTSIALFFAFAQMSDYSDSALSKVSAAFSLLTFLAFATYHCSLVRHMKLLKKQQQKTPQHYHKFLKDHPELDCFSKPIHPKCELGCYLVLLIVGKKLLACLAFGLLYGRPLFALVVLGGTSAVFGVLIAYYKPLYNLPYNYVVAGSSFGLFSLYLLVGVMQFNYDAISWHNKWIVGWFACMLVVIVSFGMFFYVAYRLVTKGFQRIELQAEEASEDCVSRP